MIWRSTFYNRLAQAVDFVTAAASLVLAYRLWGWLDVLFPQDLPPQVAINSQAPYLTLIYGAVFVILFDIQKAYSYQRFTSLLTEFSRVLKACFMSTVLSIATVYLMGYKNFPRTMFVLLFFVTLGLFLIEKSLLFFMASIVRKKGRNRKRILLVGTGPRAAQFIEAVGKNFGWGLDIIGLLTGDESKVGKTYYGFEVIDSVKNIEKVLSTLNPEEVVIAISSKRFNQLSDVLEACEKQGVQVRLNADYFGHITKNVRVDRVYGLNIVSLDMVRHTEPELFLKRIIDIVGATIALLLFLPFMVAAAVTILLTDGRPIFYEWNVIGYNKKPFKSWKFRTMCKDADIRKRDLLNKNEMSGPVFKIKHDPRILPAARWIRKFSIDETPQLFSVIKGDMSLVGPRPAGKTEILGYEHWQRRKLSVKPGLTCLWQVRGRNNVNKFDDWVMMDLEYIDNWSVSLDLEILAKTIPAIISGRGAR